MIRYNSVVLICADIQKTRRFYQDFFEMEVELDIGGLVSFKGGISLWQQSIASELMYHGVEPSPPQEKPDQEIYFETDDIDRFYEKIQKSSVRLLHPIQITPWQQRTVRFFDPDDHLIEVGESMEEVIRRLKAKGNTPEKVAELTSIPIEIVKAILNG